MGSYLLRRLGTTVIVFFVISVVVFTLIQLAPGDPVAMQIPPDQYTSATQDFIESKRRELGLDKPLPIQYFAWAGRALTGDLGLSIRSGRPVAELIGERIIPTVELMSLGLLVAIIIALVFGTWAAVRKNKIVDYVITFLSMLTISTPGFFIGIVAIYIFAVKLRLLPSAGMSTSGVHTTADLLQHLVLPVSVLGIQFSGGLLRYVRGSIISELTSEYIRTGLAKGMSKRQVVVRHVFRNALIPIITVIALMLPSLLGGAVLIETIFAWPGMGTLVVDSAGNRDYPILIAVALIAAIMVLLANFLADVLYSVVDPRVKLR